MTETTLPDNLKSRIGRAFVRENEFKDDSGNVVKYKRFVIAGEIKGEDVEIEVKVDKKDLLLLSMFDVVDQPQLGDKE